MGGDFVSDDKNLEIKLIYDRHGYLQAEVKNGLGRVTKFRDITDVAILRYEDRPWPLGASKLSELEPEEVVKPTEMMACQPG